VSVYEIEIDYTTGCSFSSERIIGEPIGIVTTDIIKAKENLKRIKEHYVNHADSPDFDIKYTLKLLTDDGERTITPFWIGYFETLHGAKITTDDEEFIFNLED